MSDRSIGAIEAELERLIARWNAQQKELDGLRDHVNILEKRVEKLEHV